jgi:Ca-activated chloride channel family protein
MGNYKDSKIQTLAKKGNGNFAYLDNFKEAEKVLLKEFTQTLYSVADNVYMDIEFNPEFVKDYRLIGFDNKVGVLRDSLSVLEGGEIGSGYSMIALFEIVPGEANNQALQKDITTGKFAEIILKYQQVNDVRQQYYRHTALFDFHYFEEIDKCYRFSAAVALFGSLLRNSQFVKQSNWNEVIVMAQSASGAGDMLQKEFIAIVQQTKALYSKVKKKRGGSAQAY